MFLIIVFARDLNESSLLWNLKTRYDRQNIYVGFLLTFTQLVSERMTHDLIVGFNIDVHGQHFGIGEPLQDV